MAPRPASRRHPRPRITLDQLHTFLAVAEVEHVTGAAERLRMSQSSVSAAVNRLEESLGLPLFSRVGRNVRLTDIGRAVRQLALRSLEDVAQIEELASGYLAFDSGEVAIASGRVMGAHRLSRWLAPFVSAHPGIDVRIVLGPMQNVLARLDDGSADIAIVGSDVRLQGVETIEMERTELVLVVAAGHPLASEADPMRALRRHRYLAHEAGTATQLRAARVVGRAVDEAPTIELEEGALLAALLAGIGYAVMPRSVVEEAIDDGRLTVLRHHGPAVMQRFTAVRREALHTPAVQAFWAQLQEVSALSS
ncbi:MAG TPA: LysR family transcriptional regulator [Candidatus Dormibacteraeota bacterium]|jgi:DNA-binding transcriptional LysR family regulator|nr:LysR family transcriptional regulator [Candidatus Dormibacteraeota bacterium]